MVGGKLDYMRKKSDKPSVVLVASPGVPVFEMSTACEVFGNDRRDITPNWYDFELVGTDPVTTIGFGLTLPAGRGLDALGDADTIVIPACADIHDSPPRALVDALVVAHARGARIASLCSGAFVLAEAGLLDGRRAATHWMHADELARRYPAVDVDAGVLYVHDDVWTSAGSAAALDLCLELVRCDFGTSIANEVARRIVIPPHRDGGQAQYVSPGRTDTRRRAGDASDIEHWARSNLATVSVAGLANHAAVSTRTLNRRFRDHTGMSPQEWLHHERLRAAQELLEDSDLTIEVTAARVGLGTAANLRFHFADELGISPTAYRRAFSSH